MNQFALLAFAIICLATRPNEVKAGKTRVRRVVNGFAARISDYPYQVQLTKTSIKVGNNGKKYNSISLCGGAIISEKIVLTAGHCLKNANVSKFSVTAGVTKISSAKQANKYKVKRVLCHEKKNRFLDYDIGIVYLVKPFKFSDNIQAIGLPDYGQKLLIGQEVIATGWGKTEKGKSDRLMAVRLTVKDWKTCRKWYPLTARMFCAGPVTTKKKRHLRWRFWRSACIKWYFVWIDFTFY